MGNFDIFHFEPVVGEEVILACSGRYYAKSVKKDHSFENLARQNFITYRHNAQTVRNWFRHHFGKFNLPLKIVLTVNSHQAIISAIHHHVGMGIVASHIVNEHIRSGRIVSVSTEKEEIINQISLVHLQDNIPTLAEKVFTKFLVDEIRSMGI